jgi:two-component system sensor histidine kinase ChiS
MYGIVSFLGFIAFYFVNPAVIAPGQYENFYIRSFAAVLSLLLIISNYWPKFLKSLLPWYWYITLTIHLPLFFTFMLLQNKWSIAWQMNELMALTLLIILTDKVTFFIIALIGVSIAFCCYYIVGNHFYIPNNITDLVTSYSTILIFCVLFNYRKDKFYFEKLKFQKKIQALNSSLEKKVSERTAELNKALKAKTEFLNNISHEVRTPVSEFSVAASNLKDCWNELDKEQRFCMVNIIARAAERLKNISMHLISATELQDAPKILRLQRSNIVELINNFLDEASVYTKEKNIKIQFEEGAKNGSDVNADTEAITQVIRHLIKNAVKYSPQDSAIKIKIESGKEVKLIISDEGIGIPENELESIFEPFTQSSRTKTGAGGVGLGLDIARKVIEAHNGKIWAKNNQVKGSSFLITFPLVKAASKELEENNSKFISTMIPETILIIDDEEVVLQALEIGLMARAKIKVPSALNGYEGIEILDKEREKIDVVVLDIMMPGINGIEILKIIRQKWPDLKVIIHSGVASKGEQDQALALGAIAFLSKPYKIEKLFEVLDPIVATNIDLR